MPKAIKKANSTAAQIRTYLRANPKATPKQVAEVFKVTAQYVSTTKHAMKQAGEKVTDLKAERSTRPTPQKWKTVHISTSNNSIESVKPRGHEVMTPITMEEPEADPVNHPAHYKVGGIETIDFIEAKRLNYNLGNAVKYITRADHKGNRKQDLEKAIWYLRRELDHSI